MEKECQMILLCGYLGSGKTTLIQNILRKQEKYKVAVIQNEFSDEMGIESPLMQDSKGLPFDKFYELPNGCLCCSAQTDLLRAVEYLITQEKYQLDFILVETNGLADPSNTIQEFWVDSDSKFPAKLKTVQTLVAVHSFDKMRQSEQKKVFERQLIYADNIFMNHIDCEKDEEKIKSIEQQIVLMNPVANIFKTCFGQLDDLDLLFQQKGYNENKQFDVQKVHNLHTDEKIRHLYYVSEDEYDQDKLNVLVGTVLWEEKERVEVMRIKGLVRIINSSNMFSLVNETFELVETEIKKEKKETKLLVIYQTVDQSYQFEQDFRNRLGQCK